MTTPPETIYHRTYDLTQARKHPSKKTPASHQREALDKLGKWFQDKGKGGILVLPTGGGKTLVAVKFLCGWPLSQGYKVLWLAHTHHLLEQAFHSFGPRDQEEVKRNGYEIGRIAEPKSSLGVRVVSGTPGHFPVHQIKAEDDVVIGTLQTITRAYNDPQQRNLKAFLKSSKGKLLVVFDEAHHSPAPSYRKLMVDLRKAYPEMYLLGLTATPTYSDESKQGWLKKLFPQEIIYQVSASKLMADQILAQPIFENFFTQFSPEFDEREYQKWVGTYRDLPEDVISRLAQSRERNATIVQTYVENKKRYGKTIIFTDRWFQCEQLREMLTAKGVKADVIYSHIDANPGSAAERNKRDKDENKKVLEAFQRNQLDVLINVRILTEGTDVPNVNTVFLTRQTTSQILLTQMVGRALRGPKFGGTEKAYIVSFIDNWQQAINWAEYDLLGGEDGNGKGTTNPPSLPLQLISIERVRELLLQMDRGIIVQVGPFIKLIPLGWYVVEFEAAVAGSEDTEEIKRETVAGSEDTEEIKREFVLVFEDDEKNYQGFIQWLTQVDLTKFEDTNLELEQHQRRLERWQQRFFPQKEGTAQKGLLRSLFHIARHMAQNDSAPTFFTFEARKDHDLDKVAQKFSFEDELNVRALDKALRNEHERKDRYWSTFYSTYNLFKSQYDGCVNRLLDLTHVDNGEDYIRPIGPIDELLDREPLEEVKVEVKARDGNRCCCCRESNRLEIDHVIPWYYGGPTSIDNLQTLCKICHTTKGRTSFDFRIHQTSMYVPSSDLTTFDINVTRNVMSLEEWEKFLRRSINFFYGCSVVDSIRTGNFSQWEVSLHAGNNPLWLKPYLEGLLNRINETLPSAGMGKLQGLRITAPNQPEVSTALGEVPVKAPNQPTMIGTAKAIPNQVEAHCARCKVKHLMLQPEWVTLSNGRSALKGKCSVCGATTHRFPKQGEIT